MADTLRLRMKVGAHEFDAEGPTEQVNTRFEAWKALIENIAIPAARPVQSHPHSNPIVGGVPKSEVDAFAASAQNVYSERVFSYDEKRDLVTLRIHPAGESKDADAVLLLIYGFRELREIDDVPVTKLTKSLSMSGIRSQRIDRLAAEHVKAQFIVKSGAAKGGKYCLTNTGRAKAEALTRELYDQVA